MPPNAQPGGLIVLLWGGKIHFILWGLNRSVKTWQRMRFAYSLVGSVLMDDMRLGEQYAEWIEAGTDFHWLALL